MIRSASATVIDRLLPFAPLPAASTDSVTAEALTLQSDIIEPYLSALEFHLASSFFPPLVIAPMTDGRPGTTLSPAAATTAVAIALIEDILAIEASSKSIREDGMSPDLRDFPLCRQLKLDVEQRPRIKAWIGSGERSNYWACEELSYTKKTAMTANGTVVDSASGAGR